MNVNYTRRSFLLPVFFILLVLSLGHLVWRQAENLKTEVKTKNGSFHEGVIGSPRFINPVLAQSQTDQDITRLVFTPLINITQSQDEPEYLLAEDVLISDNGLTYTIKLRPNTLFHDGHVITASDVVYTIEQIQDPLIKSPLSSQWQGVQAESIDQYTVEIQLVRAFEDFIYNLEIGIVPEHIWGDIDPQEFVFSTYNTNPIGNGPYTIADIDLDKNGIPTRYTLEQSSNSYEESYIEQVHFHFYEDEPHLIEGLNKHNINAAYGVSPEYLDDLSRYYTVHTETLPRVFGLFFNQNEQPLFQSKDIRTAIQKGIDTELITSEVFQGFAHRISAPDASQSNESEYNPTQAQELIEENGWVINPETNIYEKTKNNETQILEFSIAIPNIEDMQLVAESIKNQLSMIGVVVNIRSYDQGNLNQNIIRGRDYESLLFGYEIEKKSDLYAFWHSSQISDPGLNISLYNNKSVDQKLERLRISETSEFESIVSDIVDDVPAVFLYSPKYIYILPKEIKGISLENIQSAHHRFSSLSEWYTETRKVWPIFIH